MIARLRVLFHKYRLRWHKYRYRRAIRRAQDTLDRRKG